MCVTVNVYREIETFIHYYRNRCIRNKLIKLLIIVEILCTIKTIKHLFTLFYFQGIAERFGRQLSPDCSSKPRSGSVGTIELSSIRSNPFFVHDKAFRSSASRLDDRDVKTEEREKNVLKCLNNRTTSPTKNSLRENSQPKVLVHQPSGEEDLNLEIELELKNDENKNSKYSEELLNWYGRDYPVSPGIKSLSLPRCIPPPPPSPRGHRHRLPTSPTLSRHNVSCFF